MNIVGIITIISIILGLIASKYLKNVVYPDPNRNYSKLNNLCMRLAKCDDLSYKGSMDTDLHWNKNVKQAEKLCEKTGDFTGDDEFRNQYKCFFDKTTDKDYPTCIDCATQYTNDDNEKECGKPGHDMDLEDVVQLPNLNECLNITGYSTSDKKCSEIELFSNYNIKVPKGEKLDDKWWDKKKALYDCMMGKDEYLDEKWDQEWNEEKNMLMVKKKGKGVNNIDRFFYCTFCGNTTDNDDKFKKCFSNTQECYKTDYTSPNCLTLDKDLTKYEEEEIK